MQSNVELQSMHGALTVVYTPRTDRKRQNNPICQRLKCNGPLSKTSRRIPFHRSLSISSRTAFTRDQIYQIYQQRSVSYIFTSLIRSGTGSQSIGNEPKSSIMIHGSYPSFCEPVDGSPMNRATALTSMGSLSTIQINQSNKTVRIVSNWTAKCMYVFNV